MSKLATTFDAAACAERITKYHHAARRTASQAVGYAILCGKEIAEAQDNIPHGGFVEWLTERTEVSQRTAYRYLDLFRGFRPKLTKFTSVAGLLELPVGEWSAAEAEKFEKAVAKASDGQTLTQLYMDLGVVKGQSKLRGGDTGVRGQRSKLSTEEQIKASQKLAREDFGTAHVAIGTCGWMLLEDGEINAIVAGLDRGSAAMKKWLAIPKAQRKDRMAEVKAMVKGLA
jgi:hypothetical protein